MPLAAPALSADEHYKNTLTQKMHNNKGEIAKAYHILRQKKEKVWQVICRCRDTQCSEGGLEGFVSTPTE
eukprot:8803438-Ditylum_brightwellii.AAC.1